MLDVVQSGTQQTIVFLSKPNQKAVVGHRIVTSLQFSFRVEEVTKQPLRNVICRLGAKYERKSNVSLLVERQGSGSSIPGRNRTPRSHTRSRGEHFDLWLFPKELTGMEQQLPPKSH